MGKGPDGLPPKEDVARALLLRGSVFVHLDPRASGVMLPKHLKQQPQVMLQVGLDLPIPIPDLRLDSAGIYGTLSFNRSPFSCAIPWTAVFALAGEEGRGMIWESSMPGELTEEVEREMGQRPPAGLRVVDGGAKSEPPPPMEPDERAELEDLAARVRRERLALGELSESPSDNASEDEEKRRPPYLRLIK